MQFPFRYQALGMEFRGERTNEKRQGRAQTAPAIIYLFSGILDIHVNMYCSGNAERRWSPSVELMVRTDVLRLSVP